MVKKIKSAKYKKEAQGNMTMGPKIRMSAEAYQKIAHWVEQAPGEISGLGLVEETEYGFYIPEVFLLEQECTSSDTELDQSAIADLMNEIMDRDIDLVSQLRFWWHSHANMDVFWSSVDEQCISDFNADKYMVSIVFNKNKKHQARVDYFYNQSRVTCDNLKLEVDTASEEDISELYDTLWKEAVEAVANSKAEVDEFALRDKFIEILEEEELLNTPKWIDLGLKDYCDKEYKEKVRNKHASVKTYGSQYSGYQGRFYGSGNKKKDKTQTDWEEQLAEYEMLFGELEDGFEDEFFDTEDDDPNVVYRHQAAAWNVEAIKGE